MKRVSILITLLILTACTATVGSPTPSPSPTAILIPSATVTPSATLTPTPMPTTWIADIRANRPHKLSPDGKWLATTIFDFDEEQSFLQITSTANQSHVVVSTPIDGHQRVDAWSPDSTAVAVARATEVQPPCSDRSVIIYSFSDDQNELATYTFEPYPPGDDFGHCLGFRWSPDSTRFVASFIQNEFFIVDWKAQTIKKVLPEMQATGDIGGFSWTTNGLIYVVREHEEATGSLSYELRQVDLEYPDNYESLFKNMGLVVIGSDANRPRLLLVTHPEDDLHKFRLLVFNIETKQIERSIDGIGYICKTADSMGAALTALQISEPGELCGGKTNLWILDWENDRFFMHSPVDTLLSWRIAEQGFAVIKETTDGELEIIIVPASELLGSHD